MQYLENNQILIYNPNEVHETSSLFKNNLDYYTLHVNIKWCKKIQENHIGVQNNFVYIEKNILNERILYNKLLRLFEDIILNKNQKSYTQITEIIESILKKYSQKDIEEKNKQEQLLIKEVEKYVLKNINNKLSLEDISLEVKYDQSYITRVFKQKFGLTPHAFIINKRVENAKNELLKDKDISLAHLSNEVGFYDQSHFTKVFKRVFAMTPNNYRKNN
jgi:AraC-like DNA-binding protein